jgi:DNA-binding NtrC family response regulator
MSEQKMAPYRAPILVVEDSSVFREMQTLLLGQAGFAVSAHENPHSALAVAAKQQFELVVIDYELPDMNGEQFMHALRKIQPDIAVIFVSGSLTIDLAIKLSSQGVAGIFNKPANPKILLEKINETLARNAVRDTAARTGSGFPHAAPRRGSSGLPFSTVSAPSAGELAYTPRFVPGSSNAFREFTHRLWKVRDFRSVLLLQGEAGSPFELFARELAELSIFRGGPNMVCDVSEFEPRRLIEVLAPSLLSHDAGTLIVTGVEALSAAQQKILHDLTTGRDIFLPFARRFRLVLAATTELSERVDQGEFDETLYYKISSLSLSVPSLREMRGDIGGIADRILAQLAEAGKTAGSCTLAPEAAEWLEQQDWPGNYDELARTLTRAGEMSKDGVLTVEILNAAVTGAAATQRTAERLPVPAALPVEEPEKEETRPPFPLASDLAAEAAKAAAPTAPSIPLRASAPLRGLNAKSMFRPASQSYSFTQRLADALANADACVAR